MGSSYIDLAHGQISAADYIICIQDLPGQSTHNQHLDQGYSIFFFFLHIIHAPLVPLFNHPDVTSSDHTSKNTKRKRKHDSSEKEDDNHQIPTPKRKGNLTCYPERPSCSPCALWSQSGSDVRLISYLPTTNSRNAGIEAKSLAHYATFGGIQFNLNYNDCVCRPCYMGWLHEK